MAMLTVFFGVGGSVAGRELICSRRRDASRRPGPPPAERRPAGGEEARRSHSKVKLACP